MVRSAFVKAVLPVPKVSRPLLLTKTVVVGDAKSGNVNPMGSTRWRRPRS